MVLYFVVTVFLSASLLFSVQPMVAKGLLPVFGGSSSVWTTCMLFYQTVLLLGYLYAHFVMKRVSRRGQLIGHVGMLIVAIVAGYLYDTPVAPPEASTFPVPWLILQLALVSGLPFFMISSAGPLVQGWFARTGHERAHDPYFLYAASNLGSLIGLLAYPLVVERVMGLEMQRQMWLGGFGVFIVLSVGAILMTRKGQGVERGGEQEVDESESFEPDRPIDWPRRLRWVFYAFVPSSMLLGVTSHLTMDVASFPLLWVLPLAVYLLTMIVAFAVDAKRLVETMRRPMLIAVIAATILVLVSGIQTNTSIVSMVAVQLLLLGLVGLMGHGLLSADRPGALHLTEFYLIMSVGGALGGFFNGIVAPLLFVTTLEYQVALLCAAALLPWAGIGAMKDVKARRAALMIRFGLPVLSLGYMVGMGLYSQEIAERMGIDSASASLVIYGLIIFVPSCLVYVAWKDGLACVLVLAVPLAASAYDDLNDPSVLVRDRTFYGVMSIVDEVRYDPVADRTVTVRKFMHGTTNHGVQFLEPDLEMMPLGYYHYNGPCGVIIETMKEMRPDGMRVGIMGLGAGAMAAHGREQDTIVFFEIDPAVEEIARDTRYFTYLEKAAADIEVRLGDGRKLIEESQEMGEEKFDVIHADAFSSDSIPVHLLTEEAIRLYFDRLTDDGMVVLHISNRHLDLQPLVYELAAKVAGIAPLILEDVASEIPEDEEVYRFPSVWVVLTRNPQTGMRLIDAGMESYTIEDWERVKLWTDDFSNILSLIK